MVLDGLIHSFVDGFGYAVPGEGNRDVVSSIVDIVSRAWIF